MSRFYSLPVVAKKYETRDAISISFQVPDELKEQFRYIQGQYLTLEAEINGEKIRRAYSLCSCPLTDDNLTVTVKRVAGGKMSNFLNDGLQLGTRINVMPPAGRFYTALNPAQKKHYFLVGGGSGITPLISIVKTVLLTEKESRCTLVYGNRDVESIIFRQEIDQLVQQSQGRLGVIYFLENFADGWSGEKGVMSKDMLQAVLSKCHDDILDREYFLCGPSAMMEEAKQAFAALQLPQERVHIEYFTSAIQADEEEETSAETTAPVNGTAEGHQVHVKLDGKQHVLQISDRTTILQAGIRAGIDPPFSCEAGICSTCIAKVTEGSVKMDENNILTDDEVSRGFILTCQAHPLTPVVKLEYLE